MIQNFKKGDIVCLNSGGPDMTILGDYVIHDNYRSDGIFRGIFKCSWFANNVIGNADFHQESIKSPLRTEKLKNT